MNVTKDNKSKIRGNLPPWRYCPYHGHRVRSCEHIDDLESENYLIISDIVDKLGIPKTEKQVEKMALELKKKLNIIGRK